MHHRITRIFCAAVLTAVPVLAAADWPLVHRTEGNNALLPAAATVTDISGAPALATNTNDLFETVRVLIHDGLAFAVAASDGGTPFDPSDDTVRLRAYDIDTATELWESDLLDVGNTVSFLSYSAPAVDTASTTTAIYYPSGTSVQKLDVANGTILWATDLSETTPADSANDVINSSPALGDGRLYVQTTNFGTSPTLLAALDQSTGDVEWHVQTGGRGMISPLFLNLGTTKVIVADTVTAGEAGLAAYDATTGAEIWHHATVTPAWGVPGGFSIGFYGDLILDGGKIYGITYDFSAVGSLVRIDAATGVADYVEPSVGTDVPPILIDGTLYAIGGTFGNADLVGYNATTGAGTTLANLGFGVFRNYMAATNDRIYMTSNDGGLYIYTLTGTLESNAPGNYTGPVTLDANGRLYAIENGDLHIFDVQATSVEDWRRIH